jgi:C4-type Zn-finger protein
MGKGGVRMMEDDAMLISTLEGILDRIENLEKALVATQKAVKDLIEEEIKWLN